MRIAIDGPSGVGKSTISFKVAQEMNFMLIDTGAMFRACALISKEEGLQENEVLKKLENISFEFKQENNKNLVFINSRNISSLIRTPEISSLASNLAKNKKLRELLLNKQRELASNYDVVVEGRDIGTVVFPNAEVKIFLTASIEERAKRRYKELLEKNSNVNYDNIFKDIEKRDYQDTHREISPLKKADDAIEIDTSNLNLEQVFNEVIKVIKNNKDK